jgi:hypothetical protein
LGIFGSIAATPAAQRGADSERVERDTSRQLGDVNNDLQAEKAAGIGETDGDEHGANERDADGRRPWEIGPRDKNRTTQPETAAVPTNRQSKDLTGTTGIELDLTG